MKNEKTTKRFYMHKLDNLLNVQKIVTVHYQELENHYVSHTESHDFWEFNYVDKGTVCVTVGGERFVLNSGEIVFIRPNVEHFVEAVGNEPNLFIMSFSCRSDSMRFFEGKKITVPETYRYLLQNVMSEAEDTFVIPDFDPDLNKLELKKNPNLGGEQVIKNSLELLFVYLLRHTESTENEPQFFVSKFDSSTALQDEILRYLSAHLYSDFSLDDLCLELHYCKTHLCTVFRKQTGTTIYHAYLKLKTDEAKRLIRRKVDFSTIAEKLCFDSVSHFHYVFKKYAGMTPGEYKASIK